MHTLQKYLAALGTCLLFLCAPLSDGYAQTGNDTVVWAPKGATWYFNYREIAFRDNFTSFQKYVSEGDTTINGHSATILKGKHETWTGPHFSYQNNGVVYLYDKEAQTFDTLYNFNSVPGATWNIPGPTHGCKSGKVTVLDTTSIPINGENLKQLIVEYQFEDPNDIIDPKNPVDTITARIGSHKHLLIYPGYCISLSFSISDIGPLRCYTDSTLGKYSTNYKPSCEYEKNFTSIVEKANKNKSSNVTIHPNPSKGIFYIENIPLGKYEVKVFSRKGVKVYHNHATIAHTGDYEVNFLPEKKDLPNNIYFLYIESKTGKFTINRKVLLY